MKGFFLIVDQAKNTFYVPSDNSYFNNRLSDALTNCAQNIKKHKTFKELDKTIHNYVRGANDED